MKTRKHKGRSQSGRYSNPPDSTVCYFCDQKKPKMKLVQPYGNNRQWLACAECRAKYEARWKWPR